MVPLEIRIINLLIRRAWLSIILRNYRRFQLLIQGQLFPSSRSSCSQMFFKIGALKNFAIPQEKLYSKEAPTQVFSCEYFEIFKNSFFYRIPPVAPFDHSVATFSITQCRTHCCAALSVEHLQK